jgi:glycosyltransferase involved in cell wall biosynthesis
MADARPTSTIIVPVYGNARCLPELLKRVDSAFASAELPLAQFVIVDDIGPVDAWATISALSLGRSNVIAIQLMKNFGQHNAIMCGFQHASGDVIITIDDDLQHDPESIPRLIDHLLATSADLVYGVYDTKKHAGGRNVGSWLVNRFYRFVFKMPVTVTSFRVLRRELMKAVLRYDLNFTYIDGLLAWNTQRIEMVTVPHHERPDGRSGYTFGKLATLAMNVFTNFSLIPLQLVSIVGFFAAAGGIGLGAWYMSSALLSQIAVPGYASTIVAVLVLGGLQLLSLGIIGEYIGRLHLNVNRKPQYTIRRVLANPPTQMQDVE